MKDKRSDYIIYALICLLILNIGSIFIYSIKDKDTFPPMVEAFSPSSEEIRRIEKNNDIVWDKSYLFFKMFSHSSSIINLHQKDLYPDVKVIQNLFEKIPFPQQFQRILFTRTPDIENDNSNSDIENDPTLIEDFVIIDDFEGYEDLVQIETPIENINIDELPEPIGINQLKIDNSKESIFLYHTHATESYHPTKENNYHTTKEGLNIVSVGEIMTKRLENLGHKVVHSKTLHDNPSYNKSYSRSLETIKSEREKNDNLKVLIDIHRDGVSEETSPNAKAILNSRMEIDGKSVATFFFVVGPDSENYEEVLAFAKYVKVVSDVIYPGYCTGILVKPRGRYNQYFSDYSALVEIGNNLNTLDEAKESAKILADILSLVIQKLQD